MEYLAALMIAAIGSGGLLSVLVRASSARTRRLFDAYEETLSRQQADHADERANWAAKMSQQESTHATELAARQTAWDAEKSELRAHINALTAEVERLNRLIIEVLSYRT